MKIIKASAILLATTLLGSSIVLAGGSYNVDTSASSISWKGSKVGGAHEGTVSLKSGNLEFSGGGLSGGSFEIDMTTINTTDLSGGRKKKLDGHLMSNDFFSVESFPSAKVKITNVSKGAEKGVYDVTADLSVKGISKEIQFTAHIDHNGDSATAKADIVFDRSNYDVKFRSGSFFQNLGNKLIHDDVEVGVMLALSKDS